MSKRQLLQLELILSPWVCVLWSRKQIKLSEESLEGNIYCFPSFSSSVASSFSLFLFLFFFSKRGWGRSPSSLN